MTSAFVAWGLSAAALVVIAVALGLVVRRDVLGILVDNRGRYSLTQLQLVTWSIVVLSLVSGFFWARLLDDGSNALDFAIPDQVLLLLGISVGSAGLATAIKSTKDQSIPTAVAASDEGDKPRLAQLFLAEEGATADQTIDAAKYQNFWFTAILVVAYVALAIDMIVDAGSASELTSLPSFSGTFVTLLGISHAGYIAGKLPNKPGTPRGLTVALRAAGAVPTQAPSATRATAPKYVPRNP